MTVKNENLNVEGFWEGRLIDIRGYEGEFSLELKLGEKNEVHGTYKVSIPDEESLMSQQGDFKGTIKEDQISLIFEPGKEDIVRIQMEGRIQRLKEKGLGLKGTYNVSAKTSSPFRGGILSGRTIKSLPLTKAASERPTFIQMRRRA